MKQLRNYQRDCVSTIKKRLKEVKHPLLVDASVGSGKSLIIAELLLWMQKNNYHALCLTMSSTLIKQNNETFINQGGNSDIYCSAIGLKDCSKKIVFGSPQSIANALKNNEPISDKRFNLIIIDECHNINPSDTSTLYQRIINHYGHQAQLNNYSYRIIGLTGTPYRGKAESIVGENQVFKEKVYGIPMHWLIENGFLTKPYFDLNPKETFDFNKLKVNQMGKFKQKELNAVTDKNYRLTGKIMIELQEIMKTHTGAFIFCCSKKHCEEALEALPANEAFIITGDTSHEEREKILQGAREGRVRYLININCLLTGVDVSSFDVCVWLRPTESLNLYVQGIGRVLRLHERKQYALVLDYSGNLERHGDIDDPVINEALQPRKKDDPDYCIPCHECSTWNTVHARRCIGVKENKRCDYYFEFKECHKCEAQNDSTARYCRQCQAELIDPNKKLKLNSEKHVFKIDKAKYWLTANHQYKPVLNIIYFSEDKKIHEQFIINSDKSKRYFYGQFMKLHIENSSKYYAFLDDYIKLKKIIDNNSIKLPHKIICSMINNGSYKVSKKIFNEDFNDETKKAMKDANNRKTNTNHKEINKLLNKG